MRERESRSLPYWQFNQDLGQVPIQGEVTPVHLQIHASAEGYHGRRELVPLQQNTGQRIYVHAQPYLLEPDVLLSVRLFPRPDDGAIGEVQGTEWRGLRRRSIGNAQAWSYPSERLIILWEGILNNDCRTEEPAQDPVLNRLWRGFERVLLVRFPQTERIATPSWEPLYETERWQEFLRGLDYEPFNDQAFAKEVARR